MKALFYISILLVFLLFSCTKFGRNITVKGKVVNPITGTTYSNLKVQLVKSESLSLPGGFKETKHTFTDENGNFEINQANPKDTLYIYGLDGKLYYQQEVNQSQTKLDLSLKNGLYLVVFQTGTEIKTTKLIINS